MKEISKLWFSIYNLNKAYSGIESPFIDPIKFDWAKDIQLNSEKVKKELTDYLSSHQLQGYFNTSMVTRANSWKTIALKTWDVQLFKNQKYFPVTTALLNRYPQIISASFNLLEANSNIKPHSGDTNAIYRCHLGLDIPVGLPDCGFKVKDEERPWANNQWLIFMDAYEHEAWNHSTQDRYIFLIDVLRDEFILEKAKVCSTVLTSLFLQKRAEKLSVLHKLKPGFVKALALTHRPFAQAALFVSNTFKLF